MVLQDFSRVKIGLPLDVLLCCDEKLLQLVLEFESDGFEIFSSTGVHAEDLHSLV